MITFQKYEHYYNNICYILKLNNKMYSKHQTFNEFDFFFNYYNK